MKLWQNNDIAIGDGSGDSTSSELLVPAGIASVAMRNAKARRAAKALRTKQKIVHSFRLTKEPSELDRKAHAIRQAWLMERTLSRVSQRQHR
jgi:hypothetical protein